MNTTLVTAATDADIALPPTYVFPPSNRPGTSFVPRCDRIPTINLTKTGTRYRAKVIDELFEAAEEFGIFKVVSHGINHTTIDNARHAFKEFFQLPAKEKAKYLSFDLRKKFILYPSSIHYDKEALHYWRDAARHSCTPIEECKGHWPQNPSRYREVVGNYVTSIQSVGKIILDLLCEGLDLPAGYFEQLDINPNLTVNHYPACPEPKLTWAAGEHNDPGLITILLQDDVPGLQVLKDGKWLAIEPNPDAFLVNIGNAMEIISNGRFKSLRHRVVTNASTSRLTAAYFMELREESFVEPARALLSPQNPPIYTRVQFGELLYAVRRAFMGETDCGLHGFMQTKRMK